MLCQVQLQVGSGGCAEVTLVTLEVALRGVVIGKDVAIELQWVDTSSSPQEGSTWSNSYNFLAPVFKDYLFWFHLGSACKLVWI